MFDHDPLPDSHPCVEENCKIIVEFDDEPFCFKHSADSGSMVPGYSYKATVSRE